MGVDLNKIIKNSLNVKKPEAARNINASSSSEIDNIFDSNSSKKQLNNGRILRDDSFNDSEYDIPEGYSHYEYGKSWFDIYKKGKDYQSQFVHPKDFSRDDFNKHFPNLKPVLKPEKKSENKTSEELKINGKIDEEVIQGATGDCWLISALYSMCMSDSGAKIIQDAINVNDDGSVTISFAGVGVSYTMTPEEISQFDTDSITNDEYSNGDNDVLAMEIAVQKLYKDMKSGRVSLDTTNPDIIARGSGIEDGGLPSQLIYYLTGVEPNQIYNDDLSDLSKNQIYELLQNAHDSGNYSLTFGVYKGLHTATLTDGTTYEIDLGNGGHALAITDVGEDTVTFVNPWDTSKQYTMSWKEFAELGVGYMCSANLNESNTKDNIVDMTDESNYIEPGSGRRTTDEKPAPHFFNFESSERDFDGLYDYFGDFIRELLYSKEADKKDKKDKEKVDEKE